MDRLDTVLKARAGLEPDTVARARAVAQAQGTHVLRVLFDMGAVSADSRAEIAAEALGLPRCALAGLPEAPFGHDRLTPDFLRRIEALPLGAAPGNAGVRVAMVDPFDTSARDTLRVALRQPIHPEVIDAPTLERALARLYADTPRDTQASNAGPDTAQTSSAAQNTSQVHNLARPVEVDSALEEAAQQAPVVRTVKTLIDRAVRAGASDIHIEPFAGRLRARFRIDGLLVDQPPPDAAMARALVSRLKIMARLNISERRLPQDGRFSHACDGREIDIRMSSIPTVDGESVVLRLLDKDRAVFDFASLGMPTPIRAVLEDLLTHPSGIVLITGPTGSGKTTTLYAALQRLNAPERKILSIEDPVEYQLNGINQMAVQPAIGLDFATLLRSVLRQDPDIVMVGELRDAETAEIAARAALTGHLVLSTVHTNTATGAVTRLGDLGVPGYLTASIFRAALAQRLLRRVCPACAGARALTPTEVARLAPLFDGGRLPETVAVARGCEDCGHTGYKGRIGLYEVFRPTHAMTAEISAGTTEARLMALARAEGQGSLQQDGLAKLAEGITTPEELERALGAAALYG